MSARKASELTRHDVGQMRWMSGVRANNLEVHNMDIGHIIMSSIIIHSKWLRSFYGTSR